MKKIFMILLVLSFPLFGQTINRKIAITIDDLPYINNKASVKEVEASTTAILNALKKHNATAVGFVTESKLAPNKQKTAKKNILRMWLNAGMELGNHSFSHFDFSDTPLSVYEKDILKGEEVTVKLNNEYGRKVKYFRYPFNHTGLTIGKKDSLENFLKENNYVIAPFTIEHSDYVFEEAYSKAKSKKDYALMEKIKSAYIDFIDTVFTYHETVTKEYLGYECSQIFLIHASEINALCLDSMLTKIAARGYSFISFEEALQDKAYSIKDNYVGKYGLSWLHRWCIALGKKMNRKGDADPPQFILDIYEGKY